MLMNDMGLLLVDAARKITLHDEQTVFGPERSGGAGGQSAEQNVDKLVHGCLPL
jgi:hypothetical protein